MGNVAKAAVAASCLGLAVLGGCSGGGGAPAGGQVTTSNLKVRTHTPASDQEQVARTAHVRLELDGPVIEACLDHPDTGLFDGSGARVPGSFFVEDDGRVVRFHPAGQLAVDAEYTFRLSPFTCDTSGRLLDADFSFEFRALDDVPPVLGAASIAQGVTGISQSGPMLLAFDEPLDRDSLTGAITLTDDVGNPVAVDLSMTDGTVSVDPVVDLVGGADYTLDIRGGTGGVTDDVGNPLASDWSATFTAAADTTPPIVVTAWPQSSDMSPEVHPRLTFSESLNPATLGSGSIHFVDDGLDPVPFSVVLSADQRTVRLVPAAPLSSGTTYTITVHGGTAAVEDVTGNVLVAPQVMVFSVGSDSTAPQVIATDPAPGSVGLPAHAPLRIDFDEELDPTALSGGRLELWNGAVSVPVTGSFDSATKTLVVAADSGLTAGTDYSLVLRGGPDGLRDLAGNPLPTDHLSSFRTSDDTTVAVALLAPTHGHGAVPINASMSAVFDSPMDPTTLNGSTVFVRGPWGAKIPGTTTVSRGNRVVQVTPTYSLSAGASYSLVVLGGPNGVREETGNWLPNDQISQFKAGLATDLVAPIVSVTVNDIDDARKQNVSVPTHGFTIDVSAIDPVHYALDMSTVELEILGSGTTPGPEVAFVGADITGSTLRYELPPAWSLAPGDYTLTARVRDLAGNQGSSGILDFQVRGGDPGAEPFEQMQIVWVRFDLDRNGNGRDDLLDDLLRLGLATDGDPRGTNQFMRTVMQDGILARCHTLFLRQSNGDPIDAASMRVRLTETRPLGIIHSQIACAGLDPEGDGSRSYGERSTGTLGRAWFDLRNSSFQDNNTGTSPGLGVFPGEVFLFESYLHNQIGPSFTTSFARSFRGLSPEMGGTPAGSHPSDGVVLQPDFDYASASPTEQARYNAVMQAADDWATVVGTILAHELGHSFGLTASGNNPGGLHGDSSLHNEFSSPSDIMASALGYDSLIYLNYRFRDINRSYLQQTLLQK